MFRSCVYVTSDSGTHVSISNNFATDSSTDTPQHPRTHDASNSWSYISIGNFFTAYSWTYISIGNNFATDSWTHISISNNFAADSSTDISSNPSNTWGNGNSSSNSTTDCARDYHDYCY